MYEPNSIELLQMFEKYTLTHDQKEAAKRLQSFLEDPSQEIFLLQGYAGTGKTFLIRGLIRYLTLAKRPFLIMAPTGKAARVVTQKTGYEAFTIHKAIYNTQDFKEFKDQTYNVTFKYYFDIKPNLDPAKMVYIIDEASMISDNEQDQEFIRFGSGRLLNDLLRYINRDNNDQDKKILFIGDNAQLPPVGMSFSPALKSDYLLKTYGLQTQTFEMQEVVRQRQESMILHNAQKLRNALKQNRFTSLQLQYSPPEIEQLEAIDVAKEYINHQNATIIAYSNKKVKEYNNLVRQSLGLPKDIQVGDKIISLKNGIYNGVLIANGDIGEVVEILGETEVRTVPLKNKNRKTGQVVTTPVKLYFRDVKLRFELLDGKVDIKCKIIENLLYSPEPALSSDENRALYVDCKIRYKHLQNNKEKFTLELRKDPYFNAMRIKFGYALTCHKAQGSEWKNVFVDCENLSQKLNSLYFRWLYTAITRSQERLFLINPPNIDILDSLSTLSANIQKTQPEEILVSNLKSTIHKLLTDQNIDIISISTHNFHDIYYIGNGVESGGFKMFYNKEGVITKLLPLNQNSFSQKICEFLQPHIRGRTLIGEEIEQELEFEKEFQKELYDKINSLLTPYNITIQKIEHGNYYERYHFNKNGVRAVIDFRYNAKGQFTSTSFLEKRSDKTLLHQLFNLLGNR